MRLSRQILASAAFALLVVFLTANVRAVSDNSRCNGSGGCWTACNSSKDGSSQVIGASQVPECSYMAMSNCTGGQEAICGVQYSYSSDNCDPTTITDSHYTTSNTCSP